MGQKAARAAEASEDVEEEAEAPVEVAEASEASDTEDERPERPARRRGRGPRARGGRGRSSGGRQQGQSRRSESEDAPAVAETSPSSSRSNDEPQDDQKPEGDDWAGSADSGEGDFEERQPRTAERPPAERDAEAEQLVAEVLDYFLATMGVVAETYVRDDTEDGSLVFEIEGEDAGLLIGRRGETLQALQFLVRMVVSRQLGRKAFVMIDVEDYRQRRAEMLQRLARRTAGRVASSGRSSALDPMSPGERRIVHMSLASHKRVKTESEGEGNQRRVVILPRN